MSVDTYDALNGLHPKQRLIAFEKRVAEAFADKQIKGPVHLSGGNEDQLIEIFKEIHPEDWLCCSYRQHYHALLHGIPEEKLFAAICEGHSMTLQFPEHRFFSTAIVGGQLSIAVGIAAALKRKECKRKVWVFCGDMAASVGAFNDALNFARANALRIKFIVEDNDFACDTPTWAAWGYGAWVHYPRITDDEMVNWYCYERVHPHVGVGKFIQF